MKVYIKDFIVEDMIKSRGDFGDNTANLGSLFFHIHMALAMKMCPSTQIYPSRYVYKQTWDHIVTRLEVEPGRLCRHDDPLSWTSNPNTMSRDQIRPMLRAAKMVGDMVFINDFHKDHKRRLCLFMPNTRRNHAYPPGSPYSRPDKSYTWKPGDFTGVFFWAFMCRLRGKDKPWLFKMADKISILKSKQYVAESAATFAKKGHYGDLRNHIEHLIFCKVFFNTKENDEAIRILAPIAWPAYKRWFSREREEVPLGDVAFPIIRKFYGGR